MALITGARGVLRPFIIFTIKTSSGVSARAGGRLSAVWPWGPDTNTLPMAPVLPPPRSSPRRARSRFRLARSESGWLTPTAGLGSTGPGCRPGHHCAHPLALQHLSTPFVFLLRHRSTCVSGPRSLVFLFLSVGSPHAENNAIKVSRKHITPVRPSLSHGPLGDSAADDRHAGLTPRPPRRDHPISCQLH